MRGMRSGKTYKSFRFKSYYDKRMELAIMRKCGKGNDFGMKYHRHDFQYVFGNIK
jgi:hypothetical protein